MNVLHLHKQGVSRVAPVLRGPLNHRPTVGRITDVRAVTVRSKGNTETVHHKSHTQKADRKSCRV